jgi:hypothetical protein
VSEEEYISIVGEIFDGYTEFEYAGRPAYLKHFSIRDQRYIHRYYDKYKNIALQKGIPSEKEILVRLKNDDLWSDSDDLNIANLEFEITKLKESQKAAYLPSQKSNFNKTILEKNYELSKLLSAKKEISGNTAESYASTRTNEEFIRYILFKDETLKEHLFSQEEFDDLEDYNINYLVKIYSTSNARLSEDNIQHCVLRDFFNMYLSQTEHLSAFYGKPIIQLSIFQLKLALYARVFFNIFQYNEDLPDNIKKDPSAILRFSESKKTGKQSSQRQSRDSESTVVFGATKEDLKQIDPNARTISLEDAVRQNGGSLNMEQMMKLMDG